MTAEIISVGDELLIGQVVNTNSSWIAQRLHSIGISIMQITAIPDNASVIKKSLDEAYGRSEVILMTGGLGPTRDDITKHTLCDYFGSTLVFHQPSFEIIQKLFSKRGWQMNEHNRKQAELPSNCIPIPNYNGTAPGMWFEKDGKILVSMPGVPFEMEAIMEDYVLPRLTIRDKKEIVLHKTIQTQGVGESSLMEMIAVWEESLPVNFKLAYLPQPGIVRLRLTACGESEGTLHRQLEAEVESLKKIIPDLIFGYDTETLEEVVGKRLRESKSTLCTAESCTGGYISHLLTSVPGSSDYYQGSVIAYANRIKQEILGVTPETLARFGAVSEQVVKQMAEGARRRLGTDYALATSGVAGPDGGSSDKPVGLVWIALATPKETYTRKAMFGEHRGRNIRRASLEALNMLRLELIKRT